MEINNREDLKKVCKARLEAIEDQIPPNYLNLVFEKDSSLNVLKVKNTREGKVQDLAIIKLLEEVVNDLKAKEELNK
jgi:hypothetical protein